MTKLIEVNIWLVNQRATARNQNQKSNFVIYKGGIFKIYTF